MCTVDMLDLQFPPPPLSEKARQSNNHSGSRLGGSGGNILKHPLSLLMINSLARNERFKNLRKLGAEQID